MTARMVRRAAAGLGVIVALFLAACGGDGPSGPPDIDYGRDVCTDCNMIISEPRFAAAFREESGEEALFDDIGDLVRYGHQKGVLADVRAWVHDYDDESWIDAADAWFVKSDIQTPMASGLVAFAKEDDATTFASDHDGEVFRWTHLVANAEELGKMPMNQHGESHGG